MGIPISQIPISQIPNVQRTDTTIQADPNAAAAPFEAMARAGGEIGRAGAQIAAFQKSKERAKFAGESAALDSNLKNSFNLYQIEMLKEGDEAKWGEGWDETANNVRSEFIDKSRLNDRQRKALGVQFDQANQKFKTDIKLQTSKREIQRSKAQIMGAAETDLEDGDFESFSQKLDLASEANLIDPEEKRVLLDKGEERMDFYEVSSLIETDPRLAEDLLTDKTETGRLREFKNLSVPSRNSLTGMARQAVVGQQIDLHNNMMLGIEEGKLMHPDTVIQMAKDGKLRADDARSYNRAYHSATLPKRDAGSYTNILSAINAYDAKNDPSREAFEKILGSVYGQPKEDVTHLRGLLEKKLTPGSTTTGKSYKEGYDLITGWFDSGVFGNTSDFEGVPDDKKAFEKAQRSRLELVDELDRFTNENPNAGGVEVFDHLSGYTHRSRVGSGINLLTEESFPIDTLDTERRDFKIDEILNR